MILTPREAPKQWQLYKTADARINIAHGAVRSGKSVGTIWCWIRHIAYGPDGDLLMVGKTAGALLRNVVSPYLLPLLGSAAKLSMSSSNPRIEIGSRTIYLAGANDARAEEKIRGMTLAGAYGDELTTWAPGMLEQIDARMSVAGAKFWGTTNPDAPLHPIKKDWIDRADGHHIKQFHFRLEDNPFLAPEYIESLRHIHVGLWAKRFVEGLWAVAEGAVWPMFDPSRHVVSHLPQTAPETWVGLDAGFTHPAVAEALRATVEGQRLVVVAERDWTQTTEHAIAQELGQWVVPLAPIRAILYDPSAPSLGQQLRLAGLNRVRAADNKVAPGLANVASLFSSGRLVIHESAEELIQEIPSYVWDAKAQARGEDKPVKENDDHCDALRYGVQGAKRVWREWIKQEGHVEEYEEPPAPGSAEAYALKRKMRRESQRRRLATGSTNKVTGW